MEGKTALGKIPAVITNMAYYKESFTNICSGAGVVLTLNLQKRSNYFVPIHLSDTVKEELLLAERSWV